MFGSIQRGVRNTFRNGTRTVSIIIILGLSTGLALTMFVARQTVQAKIDAVKASIGNTISISPAGANGFEGGGEPLTNDQVAKVKKLPHVIGVTATVNDRLRSEDTNLQSAIDAGSLGQKRLRVFATDKQTGGMVEPSRIESFTPPIISLGTNNLSNLAALGGGNPRLTAGRAFDPTVDQPGALVGQALASKNNLSVGSTFQAYGTTITVRGIFDAGNRFANSALVLPLPTAQRLSGQSNNVTSAVAQVDSITNLDNTVSTIKQTLGSTADVTSQQDSSNQALAPLESIMRTSLFSLIGAVGAGAIITLLTMLMIVRERRREIGVLKAIGASNLLVMLQFMSEAISFTRLTQSPLLL